MNDWVQPNLGKVHLTPDPPNGIDGQCVNLASSWSIFQGGPELLVDTAYNIWLNFRHPFYDVIPYPTSVQAGDIVFYKANVPGMTGSAGHVDVLVKTIPSGFQALDTNWNNNPTAQYVSHTFTGIAGVFRKHNSAPSAGGSMDDNAKAVQYLHDRGWDAYKLFDHAVASDKRLAEIEPEIKFLRDAGWNGYELLKHAVESDKKLAVGTSEPTKAQVQYYINKHLS